MNWHRRTHRALWMPYNTIIHNKPMNYQDQLLLEINQIWQQLTDAGWKNAADSVDASASSAGNDVTKLMAAHDYACWHLQELEKGEELK